MQTLLEVVDLDKFFDAEGTYVIDASELNWEAGYWPEHVRVMHDGTYTDVYLQNLTESGGVYQGHLISSAERSYWLHVVVYND